MLQISGDCLVKQLDFVIPHSFQGARKGFFQMETHFG